MKIHKKEGGPGSLLGKKFVSAMEKAETLCRRGTFEWVLRIFDEVEELKVEEPYSTLIEFMVETRYRLTGYDLEALKWFYKNHNGVYELDEEGAKNAALLYHQK